MSANAIHSIYSHSGNDFSSKKKLSQNHSEELSSVISGNKSREDSITGLTESQLLGLGGTIFASGLIAAGLIFKRQYKNIKLLKNNVERLSAELTGTACKTEKLNMSLAAEKSLTQKQAGSIEKLTGQLEASKSKVKCLEDSLSQEQQLSSTQAKSIQNLSEQLKTSETKVSELDTQVKELSKESFQQEMKNASADLANRSQQRQINTLKEQLTSVKIELETLNGEYATAQKKITSLERKVKVSEKELQDVISAKSGIKVDNAAQERIEKELAEAKLNYDPMNPYLVQKPPMFKPEEYTETYESIKTGTQNRAGIKAIEIPAIKPDGSFDFELPAGEMKIRRPNLRAIDKPFEFQSNISEAYGNSVVWNDDKVARDLLQNFFDGHGQTLDGVRLKFLPLGEGKFKVRIEGKSTYDFKHAVIMGESTSHNIDQAAGNYGEGLKMATLKLLKQNEASQVRIGAGNWEVKCSIKADKRMESDLMHYRIEPVPEFDGNFIEFETSNQNLMETLRKSINRFYHSSNEHFKTPDFENELFGIKLLPSGQKGGIYISGQRFEYDGKYDGLEDAIIFIKRKIPENVYDMSRDRGTINFSSFYDIAKWLVESATLGESKQIIKVLENNSYSLTPLGKIHENALDNIKTAIKNGETGAIRFPDKCVARCFPSNRELESQLESNGYKLFSPAYENIGMRSMKNMILKARQHVPLEPTESEEKKIKILKMALNRLQSLTKEHFSSEELDAHIHLFNAKSTAENSITRYDNALAEAIIDNGVQKGFWIDRNYINTGRFSDVLETALHELSHKVGGDGTEVFGYKLTSVNKDAIAEILENPEIAKEFKILSDLWEKTV